MGAPYTDYLIADAVAIQNLPNHTSPRRSCICRTVSFRPSCGRCRRAEPGGSEPAGNRLRLRGVQQSSRRAGHVPPLVGAARPRERKRALAGQGQRYRDASSDARSGSSRHRAGAPRFCTVRGVCGSAVGAAVACRFVPGYLAAERAPHGGRCALGRRACRHLRRPNLAGRVAASLLHAVGLPELVTQSLDDYELSYWIRHAMPRRLRGSTPSLSVTVRPGRCSIRRGLRGISNRLSRPCMRGPQDGLPAAAFAVSRQDAPS